MTAILDRRIHAFRPDLAARSLAGRIEATRLVDPQPMRIGASSAPLRREPRPDAPLDTEALAGELVQVYEREEGWAWVQLARDGYVGYLPDDALRPDAPAPTHRVATLRTFVYPGPAIKLPPLAALSLCAGVTVVDAKGDFAILADGGHVFATHLAPDDRYEADFVAVAERFLGVPYLWGGKTSLGLDCSGLVQLSLAAAGIAAPRDSDMMEAALGRAVAPSEDLSGLARGDLVFWKGHVGVLTDPGTLLHASGHVMRVDREPLREARDRIRSRSSGEITGVRRLG